MKRKLLLGLAVLSFIIAACNNPFFPEKKEGIASVNANAPVIIFEDSALSDTECVAGEDLELSVSVEGDEDDYTYQWYSNTENSNEGGTPIGGATGSTFNPPTDEEGTTYYYVVVTDKKTGKTTKSRPVKVTVDTVGAVIKQIADNMVTIPAGTFMMGSPASEPNRYSNETQHSVTLSSFKMSKYQVTQEQWEAVMGIGTNPSFYHGGAGQEPAVGENQGRRPVEQVSWYDALVFCNKLSIKEGLTPAYSISGKTNPADWGTVPTNSDATWNAVVIVAGSTGYRLPTEAQWEYACRAGTTTAYNTGDTISDSTGWYSNNSGSKTHEVGKKPANAWGLYDMHGNVWEWCWDWYGSYSSGAQIDPMGASSGTYRVLRGGSWFSSAERLRSAIRYYYSPYIRDGDLGFRLVRP